MRGIHGFEELVFWHIHDRIYSLRGAMVGRFGVSLATVSRAVALLIEKGLILETPTVTSASGRKPHLLQVNPKLATLVGLEIDVDRVTAVITDLSGGLLGRGSVRCDAGAGVQPVIAASQKAVTQALSDAAVSWDGLRHVGVGHPGGLDVENGVCLHWSNVPAWRDVPLRSFLEAAFGVSVTLDDRSRAVALAERRTSPEDGNHPNALYVQVGTGIGSGAFVEGRLVRGATQMAGEIGNIVIDMNGPPCQCGRRGCVEAFATSGAVVNHVRRALDAGADSILHEMCRSSELSVEIIASAARRQDRVACAALERAGTALGVAVANIVQVLNPSLIVLCGRLARLAGPFFLESVHRAVRQKCVELASRNLQIRVAAPKKDIAPVGCALLAAEAEAQRLIHERLSTA